MFFVCFFDPSEVRDRKLILMVYSASKRSMKSWPAFSYHSLIFFYFLKADILSTCFMLCPSCKASEAGTFPSNRDSSLNPHSSFTVTATIIVNNVGKVITFHLPSTCSPRPLNQCWTKLNFVFVRNYSYLSQHGIGGTGGIQEKSK